LNEEKICIENLGPVSQEGDRDGKGEKNRPMNS